jgi:hypothetical protein
MGKILPYCPNLVVPAKCMHIPEKASIYLSNKKSPISDRPYLSSQILYQKINISKDAKLLVVCA